MRLAEVLHLAQFLYAVLVLWRAVHRALVHHESFDGTTSGWFADLAEMAALVIARVRLRKFVSMSTVEMSIGGLLLNSEMNGCDRRVDLMLLRLTEEMWGMRFGLVRSLELGIGCKISK